MNIGDVIKRGPGRPPKVPTTAVQDALAAPLPDGVAAALAKADAAFDVLRRAEEIGSRVQEADSIEELDRRSRAAQVALQRALAQQDVARQLGDEGPTVEEIAELRQAAEAAKNARDNVAARDEAYAGEIAKRGEVLIEAAEALRRILAPWREAVIDAADDQIGKAVHLLGEALVAARQVDPRGFTPDNHIEREGLRGTRHKAPDKVALDPAVADTIRRWDRYEDRAGTLRIHRQSAERRREVEPEPVPQAIPGFVNGRMDLRSRREGGAA